MNNPANVFLVLAVVICYGWDWLRGRGQFAKHRRSQKLKDAIKEKL